MAKSVKGTQTEKNLLTSFAGESQARMRYTYFASTAKKEGYEQIAAIFTETADQEKEHAKRMFKWLEGGMVEITASYPAGIIGTTMENLKAAAAGENEEVSFSTVTFTNDRQKASVSLVKQDGETRQPLAGAVFGMYAGNDIVSADGNVIVRKDTLIEKVATGTDGKAGYTADLPVNNSYYIKELQAPQMYVLNTSDVYSFAFNYAGDKEKK